MHKHLYDSFKHWYDLGGTIWFYSDPHFADEEMKYLRKNYIGDAEQVKRINSKVTKHDTLVILGDIGDVEWVKRIRAGRKVLIMGNHDKGASNYKRGLDFIANSSPLHVQGLEDNKLFDEVYEGVLMISDKIMLSHEPVNFKYAYNIHGHDHSNWFKGEQHLNLCAELIDYTPVSLKQIVKSGALSKVPNIHRDTIDRAIERKEKKK